jgi:hypothetical protein
MLERYRDGEPVPELSHAIEAHLGICDWCRGEFQRIQGESPAIPAAGALPEPEAEGVSTLLTRLRNWQACLPEAAVLGPAVRRLAAQEIGLYLGRRAAQEIVQPVTDDARNLIPAIEPCLGLFLGRKAASHLSSHIVEMALVRH